MRLRRLVLIAGIVPAALGASLFAACGSDGGGGGTGSDEDFVADLCKAGVQFQEDIEKLLGNAKNIDNEKDAAKAFAEPFEDFAKAFAKLKPPADLKDWHKDASDSLNEAVDALKDGNLDADIFSGDQPFDDPPKAIADRLTKIAEKNEDCQKADFSFGS